MIEEGPLQLNQWRLPDKFVMEGKYCRLEPLDAVHLEQLYEVLTVEDSSKRYRYLFTVPPIEKEAYITYMNNLITREDYIPYVVIDKSTNRVEGLQNFMSINPTYGTVEIGGILWGPKISRTRITTEAFYLFTCHIFDDLHYRRYEWKCNNDNIPSKNAALRFGFQFEGIFRQHLIQQGWNRDTTYFSMLDKEWPNVKRSLELWLSEENFDEYGQQIRTLRSFQEELNNK
jgi:RimJ/RimL family protein N-acetyltransferase